MTTPHQNTTDADAQLLRAELVRALADSGHLGDPRWRKAVETVPRHWFTPGFYLPAEQPSPLGMTWWEPVTARIDHRRWLAAVYSNITLVTQLDGAEPDWDHPVPR